ncbi:hypothetical protein NPIL_154891 [Nephila pilipes]|uniref:Uncharacterized protein n=1 Tax=Nephila pilipes TaxID=299642 RepID=A0A8X6NMS0_NEPPI|nr:hypothetical protein NPIL_154891 [Nephila pilipes]
MKYGSLYFSLDLCSRQASNNVEFLEKALTVSCSNGNLCSSFSKHDDCSLHLRNYLDFMSLHKRGSSSLFQLVTEFELFPYYYAGYVAIIAIATAVVT